jgi:hypothetical protein
MVMMGKGDRLNPAGDEEKLTHLASSPLMGHLMADDDNKREYIMSNSSKSFKGHLPAIGNKGRVALPGTEYLNDNIRCRW